MVWRWLKNKIGIYDVATYWLDFENGPSEVRYSIVKHFEFINGFKGRTFLNQIKRINKGTKYKWLVYESKNDDCPKKKLEDEWNEYKSELKKGGVNSSVIGENKLVECHILTLEKKEEQLSWNFTMYEDEVCIVERAEEGSFGNDNATIILDADKCKIMEELFKQLWNNCPPVETFIKSGINLRDTSKFDRKTISYLHAKFANKFFQFFGSEYYKHLPIYKVEKELFYVFVTVIVTIGLLIMNIIAVLVPFLSNSLPQLMTYFHFIGKILGLK